MFAKDLATMQKLKADQENERRGKFRFPMRRELRYKLLKDGSIAESGAGETVDMGSGGVGFSIERELPVGAFIELSISWPVLLDQSCPMRLNVFGRVVRNDSGMCACTIDKYEFRTQSRAFQPSPVRNDSRLQRWADAVRKDNVTQIKPRMMTA
ncbi:MAG: type pilus assembly PilZ [Thermomicrobiales bacterium]|jgi:hypothetical protein|nr:type pilus assembly PilZ [Thermomicrobiales bacterium]